MSEHNPFEDEFVAVDLVLRQTLKDGTVQELSWNLNPRDFHLNENRDVQSVFDSPDLASYGDPSRLEIVRGSHRLHLDAQVIESPIDPPTPETVVSGEPTKSESPAAHLGRAE